eukprot:4310895-Prymnesium_polylepis.2
MGAAEAANGADAASDSYSCCSVPVLGLAAAEAAGGLASAHQLSHGQLLDADRALDELLHRGAHQARREVLAVLSPRRGVMAAAAPRSANCKCSTGRFEEWREVRWAASAKGPPVRIAAEVRWAATANSP